MQRRQAGEHREAHAQPWVRRTPPGGERVPGGLHGCDVAGQRAPPGWRARRPRGRPGMDEERRVASLEHLEHRAQVLIAGRSGERVGRHARAGEAVVEEAGEPGGVGRVQPHRGPRGERCREGGDAVVVGGEQRLRLARRQRLDAERDRRRDQHAIDAVGVRERRSAVGVVVVEVDAAPPARRAAAAPTRRRSAAASEARDAATERAAAARARGAGGCRWTVRNRSGGDAVH